MVKAHISSSELVAVKLVIEEKITSYGRVISFFRNMHYTSVRPRRNIHGLVQNKVHVIGVQHYYGNLHPFQAKEYYIKGQNENINKKKAKEENRISTFFSKFSQVIGNYCSKSNLHGLAHVGNTEFNFFERFFWFLSFLTATGFATYFILRIYKSYNDTPVIVSFKPTTTAVDQIPFPAVTICNVNLATKSEAERILINGTDVDKRLLAELCNINKISKNDSKSWSAEATDDWQTVRNFIISVNQKCSDMFKVCKWEDKPISCDDYINTVLTDEGYCCSFNRLPANYTFRDVLPGDLNETYPDEKIDWNPEDGYPPGISGAILPKKAAGPGAHLGLTLVLDADLEEYYCTSTSSIGFKIRLSNPIESPKIADLGFLLSPGVEARIPIEPTISEAAMSIKSIDIKKRQCFFTKERRLEFYRLYTERNCRLECQAIYTLKKCGCVPYFLPKNATMKICGRSTEQCSIDAKFTIETYSSPERRKCNCLPGCFTINYARKIFSGGQISAKYKTVNEDLIQNGSFEHFADSMAIAHFFYESDSFRVEMKTELYGFSEFLSNTGGLLGLFLGFSFLSAVEIFFFIIYKGFILMNKDMNHDPNKVTYGPNGLPYIE